LFLGPVIAVVRPDLMSTIPNNPNFYSSLYTDLLPAQVAVLLQDAQSRLRTPDRGSFEIISPIADLMIECSNPILLHGAVADPLENIPRLLELLEREGITYSAEAYDQSGNPLAQWSSPPA
jgi:hypothetical protein